MQSLKYRCWGVIDGALASHDQRYRARKRADVSRTRHGPRAVDELLRKLDDRRRTRSRRELRLAIALLLKAPRTG